jgi:hypothetical protein
MGREAGGMARLSPMGSMGKEAGGMARLSPMGSMGRGGKSLSCEVLVGGGKNVSCGAWGEECIHWGQWRGGGGGPEGWQEYLLSGPWGRGSNSVSRWVHVGGRQECLLWVLMGEGVVDVGVSSAASIKRSVGGMFL